ncbi:Hpt domain-containing protein [Tenacibaculum maritimum]|uniref:Hpt domain-containing protein n=1 Tax=Tenacibaculum maritimum TaxID=107401 RepID=UPI0012E5B0BB|nr:Hpt domain-containing protein [Tenacibaculum maritimum]MCD9582042.1 Hpt domain-containing protein [Tenacibaculum maritimum]MCD9636239.1 Hpt domain-containing protein [Tenacibaculum maritimum]CAA0194979.1 Probable two-component system. Phosphotransfer protein (HPt) [Tenacibaculum maritimum]CAA0204809.1 Probable two-component system. Phosphotransfer protein (HPt) [Tenacibaculum maritimum]
MEQPNLTYIAQLARGDKAIKKELIHIVKTEFPEEKGEYYKNLESRNFKKIEGNVHKIKHKISILGLEKSYKLANEFEHNLREHKLDKAQDFEKILVTITEYLKTI